MRGVAERHECGLAILGHGESHRRDVALAHAGWEKLDLARDLELRPIDDVDLARELGRDPQLLAIGRRRGTEFSALLLVLVIGAPLVLIASLVVRTQAYAYPLFVATVYLLSSDSRSPSLLT